MKRQRLDAYLVEHGLVSGRDRAKSHIMAGRVFVDNQRAEKPGMEVGEGSVVELRGGDLRYVSRGGLKLEKAVEAFAIGLNGAACIDIGASTGGFTDCMLQNGARKVYAVDVGYGQLDWRLRQDPRVVVLERQNIRHLTGDQVPESLDFAGIDVSFISLSLVLPVAAGLLRGGGEVACLIKPQFEAGRDKVGKKGVVRDPAVHREVIAKVESAARELDLAPQDLTWSPVKGPEGNIEYLLHLRKGASPRSLSIDEVVAASHTQLDEERI